MPDLDPHTGSSPQYLDPAARLRRTESAGNLLPDGRIPLQVPRQRPADSDKLVDKHAEKPVKLADYQVTGPKSAPKQPQGPQPVTPQPIPGRPGSAPKLNKSAPVGPAQSPELKSGKYRSGPAKPPAAQPPAAQPITEPVAEPAPVLPDALSEPADKSRAVRPFRVPAKSTASRWLVPVGLVVGFTLTLAGVLYYLLVIAKR